MKVAGTTTSSGSPALHFFLMTSTPSLYLGVESSPFGTAFLSYQRQQEQQPAAHSDQSFLAPQHQQHGQSQSFLGLTSHSGGSSSSSSATSAPPPRTGSASRPGTSSGAPSLPPLSAVVSASLSSRDHHLHHADQSFLGSTASSSSSSTGDYSHGYSGGGGSILPFPSSSAAAAPGSSAGRPATAGLFSGLGGSSRPKTAPAFFTTSSRSFFRGVGLAAATTTTGGYDRELPLLHSGFTPSASRVS
ncbi:hypothetical protein BJ165DRAFT_860928 [Panaeolus papilionaceus]|nr:hypothetical protein BJ165DRAFT_860928 [Panaeolus papilionaceus]